MQQSNSQLVIDEQRKRKLGSMKNKATDYTPNYLWALFTNKCPCCRRGKMFKDSNPYHLKNTLTMNDICPVCEQKTEIEEGFYYGTGYVSYALTVAFSVSTFVAWWVLIGMSLDDNRVFWWLGINAFLMILLQPYFMRLSRTVWLSFFVKYDTNWKNKGKEIIVD